MISIFLETNPAVLGFPASPPSSGAGSHPKILDPVRRLDGPVAASLAGAAAAIAALGLFARRRALPVALGDVEWALLRKQPTEARRMAHRALRSRPSDADALFLYATTFLVQHRYLDLIRHVEGKAARLDPPVRRSVAFLLAVAASAVDDQRRAQRWALEASQDPLLEAQLREHGVEWSEAGPAEGASPRLPGYA